MRQLLVMRHAKSDWGAASGGDHDRVLARRGIKAARKVGRFLTDSGTIPDLILSSTAVRALTTAELAAEAGEWGCEIVTSRDLYASDPERVLDVIRETGNGVGRLLIAGHEPTWSTLVTWLIGGGKVRMPTAAVACLDLPHGDWIDLAPATCELRWLVTPKALKGK
ncbi:MAG: histidine phosphatase family protein [Thermoanaerobaculales bacterium]|nr:histidine phosphatase family protein [Thermoanaerobaculales bacterium]